LRIEYIGVWKKHKIINDNVFSHTLVIGFCIGMLKLF